MKGERCNAQAFGGLSVCGVAGGTGAAHLVVVGHAGGGAGVRVQVERVELCGLAVVDHAAAWRVTERDRITAAEAGELGRNEGLRSRPALIRVGDRLARLASVADAGVRGAVCACVRVDLVAGVCTTLL